MRLAGRAAGAWTGEEVELGWGLAAGLKELLSCCGHTHTQDTRHASLGSITHTHTHYVIIIIIIIVVVVVMAAG